MTNREIVSRISNQLRMISKDEYISDRFVLSTARTIARKFITQKIQRRSIDRDMSLYTEIQCIKFEPVDSFKTKYIEFNNCSKLSKSVKKFSDLIYTRYGSTVKELYSIDRKSTVYTESTLYQLRINSERQGGIQNNKFYILDDYIYVSDEVELLSGLVLVLDLYDLEDACDCTESCESVWDKEFISPDSMTEDVIKYSVENILMTKQIPPDEKPDLSENIKQ